MTTKCNNFSKELKLIDKELSEIWKALSQQEKRKQIILHKMNRVKMILHRLIYSNSDVCKDQDSKMGTSVDDKSSHE